jgi:hypothetical protein
MLLVGTWVSCPHRLVALTFLNMFHAAPTFLVVFRTAFNRWLLVVRHNRDLQRCAAAHAESAPNSKAEVEGGADDSSSTTMRQRKARPSSKAELPRAVAAQLRRSTPSRCGCSSPAPTAGDRRRSSAAASTKLWHFALYMAVLFALGLAEDFLWEALVWQDYTADWWEFDPARDFPAAAGSALTAALILPQATHYQLDAFLWKHASAENPGLVQHIAAVSTARIPAEWIR